MSAGLPERTVPETLIGWYHLGVGVEIALAAVTFTALMLIVAPYGRHARPGWGPSIPNRAAWILMESPAVLLFAWVFFRGPHALDAVPLLLLGLWQAHYVHRAFVFPFRTRTGGKRMPVLVALLGLTFNSLNAWVNATWIGTLGDYGADWLAQPVFWVGAAMFLGGLAVNLWADTRLIRLRAGGEGGYRVPSGGLFERVSCPNYLGELVEWAGWALATWSLAGLAFFLYVAANLVPRALANHAWYRETFPDYPPERRALVPFLL